jgi:hypothetical protein
MASSGGTGRSRSTGLKTQLQRAPGESTLPLRGVERRSISASRSRMTFTKVALRSTDPLVRSNRSPRYRNRSLWACAHKFRILKTRPAETRSEIRGLRCEKPEIPRQRPDSSPLTTGNVASLHNAKLGS